MLISILISWFKPIRLNFLIKLIRQYFIWLRTSILFFHCIGVNKLKSILRASKSKHLKSFKMIFRAMSDTQN